ncbi:MAG: HdeD family acid-resistance protein [Pseudomonadota bacterium]
MTLPDDIDSLQSRVTAAIQAHWKAFLIEGIVLVVLGLVAIVVPPLASLAVTILLGWMFIVSGIVQLALTLSARQLPGFGWSLASAILAIVAGAALLLWPVQGTLSLTIVIGVYFVMEGVATIMYALDHRKQLSQRWGWLVAAGIADLVVAALIITGLPGSATWALGLLVGLNMLFGGASMISMALAARNA